MTHVQIDINRTGSASRREALSRNRCPRHQTFLHLQAKGLPEDVFVWTFVRHPYERVLSQWKHKVGPDLSFGDWLRERYEPIVTHPNRPRRDYRRRLWWPQRRWLVDADGEIQVDFIGDFHSMYDEWERLGRELGEDLPELPWRNRAQDRRGVEEMYSAWKKDIVVCAHEPDFREFDFEI